ncbi:MAG: histidinol-phosphatase [Verrucomicrobiota bacterium]|nr:histidinol-phosphatase [Limisphaera sp.]MDW8381973.1 histidinol-phosphatase [Verrucomicrobiota bacterium]
MEWPPDYHMHTPLCKHARGEPLDYARRAEQLGLLEIGFSEHAPMPQDDFDDWRMRFSDLDRYVASVNAARAAVPGVVIRVGLEVDYLPGLEDWIKRLAAWYPWDYLIGSVHYVSSDWAIDHPGQVHRWAACDPVEVWRAYLQRLIAAAGTGFFDILGHVDLPKKFGHRPSEVLWPLWRQLFATARRAGCALEINTAGLRKPCQEMYPALKLLEEACRMGVPLTFGSDAHAPEEVGAHWPEAVRLARAAGYRQVLRLCKRRGTTTPLLDPTMSTMDTRG